MIFKWMRFEIIDCIIEIIDFFKRGSELRTRILSCKAGQNLPLKMIQLAQNYYELGVTSVTNIPMKVI